MGKFRVKELLDAVPISDSDYVLISQPSIPPNGNTRKITVKNLKSQLGFANRVIGEYHDLSYQPSTLQLVKWRLLPLQYQIIEIALYQDLCDIKWVGASANATADWWYKCNEDGTRNPDGLYMRVEDGRGMYRRGYGANAIKKAANNTPYEAGA